MPPYSRDPLSEWFDGAAEDWLARAYAAPGRWAVQYLAPPSAAARARARAELGIASLAERDRWGLDRWTRALKRAVYHRHKAYGGAGGLAALPRLSGTAATALRWETGGLVQKAGWPQRRRELRIMIAPGGGAADAAAMDGRRAYVTDAAYRSKPGPPDRPWEG